MPYSRDATVPTALLTFDHLPETAGVGIDVVRGLFGNPARSTIWRWVRAGHIPAPYKASPQSTLWNVGQLRKAVTAMRTPAAA